MYPISILIGVLMTNIVANNTGENTYEQQVLDEMKKKIISEEYQNIPIKDGYKFGYKTKDGTVHEEVGIIINPGTDKQELVVMGSFGYEEGNTRSVTMFIADKRGYRPRFSIKSRRISEKLLASLVG